MCLLLREEPVRLSMRRGYCMTSSNREMDLRETTENGKHSGVGTFALSLLTTLQSAVEKIRNAPEDEAHHLELAVSELKEALRAADRRFGLDCSVLIVRDIDRSGAMRLFDTSADKPTLFRHEHFAVESPFFEEVRSDTLMSAVPLVRTRYKDDRLWELLWQTMHLGPYASPWSVVAIPLSFPEAETVGLYDMVGVLVLIGQESWYDPQIPDIAESIQLLGNTFLTFADFVETIRKLKTSFSDTSVDVAEKTGLAGRGLLLHGVLAPLQRLELKVFRSETAISIGDKSQITKWFGAIRGEVAEVKRCIKTFFDVIGPGQALEPDADQAQWVETGRVIRTVVEKWEGLAKAKGKSIIMRIEHIPKLPIKADDLELIVTNLLHNAIKYGYPTTKIKVTYKRADPEHILDVTSYGIIIRPEDWEKIFLLGYRTPEAAKIEYAAAGIGLYSARGAAERYGAKLFVHSSDFEEITIFGETYRNTFRFVISRAKRRRR